MSDELVASEGEDADATFQDFLDVAISVASDRRLTRWVFHERKPP